MKYFIVFSALVVASQCIVIKYKPCSGGDKATAVIKSISVDPCEKLPCVLQKGSTYAITVVFAPTYDISALKTVIKAGIGPIWIPYAIPNADACKDSGLTCPLKAGSENTYKFSLTLLKSIPSISLDLSWEMKDQTNKDAVCAMFAISVA